MELYLSRMILDVRSREVRRDLADVHALHRRVYGGFPPGLDAGGEGARILFRLEEPGPERAAVLLVQSTREPDWAALPEGYLAPDFDGFGNPARKRIDAQYAAIWAGETFAFRLRANPTRRVNASHAGDRLAGKRVAILGEEDQLRWLGRKGNDTGFRLLAARAGATGATAAPDPDAPGGSERGVGRSDDVPLDVRVSAGADQTGRPRAGGGRRDGLTFGAVLFEGRLRVEDPERFRAGLWGGIGPGKGFGFGLLSVTRIGDAG